MASDRPRVTILSSDLSANPAGRAYLLAEMLARELDVEIVGPAWGKEIWPPLRDARLPIATLPRRLRGDVLYAVKPMPASFGLALLHRARSGRPVVLDVDDDELSFRPPASLRHPLRVWNRFWTAATVNRIERADTITVASLGLQQRFGGTLIPHARDTARVRPRPEDAAAARAALGLSGDARRIVLFLGTPRPHKGIEDAAAAIGMMRHPALLVVAGVDPAMPYEQSLRAAFPSIHLAPRFPYEDVGLLLAAADVVVVPQRALPQTALQMPAKLLDAMAAGKPIVATSVSDIPLVLAADGRGVVVPPADPPALAGALDAILADDAAARAMGERARAWCVENASYDAVAPRLVQVIVDAARR